MDRCRLGSNTWSGYVATAARDMRDEISFRPGGLVQRRATEVLATAREMLREIAAHGLFDALARGWFGDVPRTSAQGRGADGIVEQAEDYRNPVADLLAGRVGV